LYIGAKLAVVGSLLSVVLSLLFLPSEAMAPSEKQETNQQGLPPRSFFREVRNAMHIALRSNLWPLLTVKIVSGVSSSMYQTALPMVLTQQLHFDPAALGLSMSASMLASAAFGVVGMGFVTRKLGAMGMAQSGLLLRPALAAVVATLVAYNMVASHQQTLVIAVSVLHGLASHALATGITTQTTGVVAPDEQGTLLGLEHGLFSMARIGGPAAGTRLLSISFGAVVAACGGIDVTLLILLVVSASKAGRTLKSKDR